MAKKKLRGQKSRNGFRTASQKSFKAKNRAKPIATDLKINIRNDEKVSRQRHESKLNVDEATKLMAQL
ncbi:ribosomal biogenesis factor-like [Rhinopithecus roxellana]|uniref:ribosomal biogenesis factor-like n=1 Tax=Rhinopithecus roxellana TaxID=61622 RepID=UPI0005331DBF|nr:ribosomal biogenesis factor-like [Rhinopithecus roxellana]